MNGRRHNMGTRQRDGRDEDLALFHDMRRRERRNFLYLLADDVDVSPTATPTRTGRELLPLDSEKNDFDWLLTPPSTPLFPSLDQDGLIVNLSQRRVLTRSASVSRSARVTITNLKYKPTVVKKHHMVSECDFWCEKNCP